MAKRTVKAAPGPIESILGITPTAAREALATLTPRERQVAEMMSMGLRNRMIAAAMSISSKTLDIHRAHAKQKLKAKTSVDIARYVFAEKFSKYLE